MIWELLTMAYNGYFKQWLIPNLDMSINNDKDIKDLVGYDGICTQQYDMGLSQSGGLALNSRL